MGPSNRYSRHFNEQIQRSQPPVIGGSSGIGKSIVERLCSQSINVVLVAAPDKPDGPQLMDETISEMKKKFPLVKVLKVSVDLSSPNFMEPIKEATKGLDIRLLFCNAGFMINGMPASFDKVFFGS